MYTNQSAFTIVVTALLKQNKRCEKRSLARVTGNYYCAYRNSEGLKCAIGHLIPDDLYNQKMEKCPGIWTLTGHYPKIKELLKEVNFEMLGLLQDIHDKIDPEDWKEKFEILAKKFKLKMPK